MKSQLLQHLLPTFLSAPSQSRTLAKQNPKLAHFTRIGSAAEVSCSSSASAESSAYGSVENLSGRSAKLKAAEGHFLKCMVYVILGTHISALCLWLASEQSAGCFCAAIAASFLWHAALLNARRSGQLYHAAE